MSFDITGKEDYLKRKGLLDQVREERSEARTERFKKHKETLDKFKAEGNKAEYERLLKFCLGF